MKHEMKPNGKITAEELQSENDSQAIAKPDPVADDHSRCCVKPQKNCDKQQLNDSSSTSVASDEVVDSANGDAPVRCEEPVASGNTSGDKLKAVASTISDIAASGSQKVLVEENVRNAKKAERSDEAGEKRDKAVNAEPTLSARKKGKSTAGEEKICTLCDAAFSSSNLYDIHMRGELHLKRQRLTEEGSKVTGKSIAEPSSASTKATSSTRGNGSKKHCDVCNVNFGNERDLNNHLSGIAHKEEYVKMTQKYRFCQICQISFASLGGYLEHCKSTGHTAKAKTEGKSSKPETDKNKESYEELAKKANWRWCDLCSNLFETEEMYLSHCETLAHTQKLKLSEQKKRDEEEGADVPVPYLPMVDLQGDPELLDLEENVEPDRSRYDLDQAYTVYPLPDRGPADLGKPTSFLEFFCDLCCVQCSSGETFQQHIDGRKHKKALGHKLTKGKQKPPARAAKQSNAPAGQDVDAVVADMTGAALIQPDIMSYNRGAIIGANHVVEYVDSTGYEEIAYVCELCDARCDPRTIIQHMTGLKHRGNVFRSLPDRSMHREINAMHSEKNARSKACELAESYASQLQSQMGPGTVRCRSGRAPTIQKDKQKEQPGSAKEMGSNASSMFGFGSRYPDIGGGTQAGWNRASFSHPYGMTGMGASSFGPQGAGGSMGYRGFLEPSYWDKDEGAPFQGGRFPHSQQGFNAASPGGSRGMMARGKLPAPIGHPSGGRDRTFGSEQAFHSPNSGRAMGRMWMDSLLDNRTDDDAEYIKNELLKAGKAMENQWLTSSERLPPGGGDGPGVGNPAKRGYDDMSYAFQLSQGVGTSGWDPPGDSRYPMGPYPMSARQQSSSSSFGISTSGLGPERLPAGQRGLPMGIQPYEPPLRSDAKKLKLGAEFLGPRSGSSKKRAASASGLAGNSLLSDIVGDTSQLRPSLLGQIPFESSRSSMTAPSSGGSQGDMLQQLVTTLAVNSVRTDAEADTAMKLSNALAQALMNYQQQKNT